MKEIIIVTIIVVIIISLDVITHNYTKNSVEEISNQLQKLSQNLKKEDINYEDIKQQYEYLNKSWEKRNSKMAYFIEHNELEKVEAYITSMISFIDTGDYSLALNQIENNIFVLNHIKDKYQLSLDNLF